MSLASLQSSFWQTLLGGPCEPALFVERPPLSAEARTRIYADMFLFRQADALGEDFPKLAALLGHEAFVELVSRYVRAHPSEHPDLGRLGRHLASFCEGQAADLAALEWARCEVFVEADDIALGPEEFVATLGSPGFARQSLALVSALRLVRMKHDALGLWDALEEGRASPDTGSGPGRAVVWRSGYEVFHVAVDEDEAHAVELALQGATLADVCGCFDSPELAFAALQGWLGEGWIRRGGERGRPHATSGAAPGSSGPAR